MTWTGEITISPALQASLRAWRDATPEVADELARGMSALFDADWRAYRRDCAAPDPWAFALDQFERAIRRLAAADGLVAPDEVDRLVRAGRRAAEAL